MSSSGKRLQQTANDISYETLVIVLRIRHGFWTFLSRRQAWIGRIGGGLCTSLIDSKVWPFRIALIQQQNSKRNLKWSSYIGLILYNTR